MLVLLIQQVFDVCYFALVDSQPVPNFRYSPRGLQKKLFYIIQKKDVIKNFFPYTIYINRGYCGYLINRGIYNADFSGGLTVTTEHLFLWLPVVTVVTFLNQNISSSASFGLSVFSSSKSVDFRININR